MYSRLIKPLKSQSFFLFGPRGVGKSTWLKNTFQNEVTLDLLDDTIFTQLLIDPTKLESFLTPKKFNWIILDEVQKLPKILDEVHRLIENKKWKFVLTGSNARKLKREGSNLLAGRAFTKHMFPLTTIELGEDFNLSTSLRYGHLPGVYQSEDPSKFLTSYIGTYLREEVQQEAMVRNLDSFTRFLQAASFSQTAQLSIKSVADDCGVARKTVEGYFDLLEDLLIGSRLKVFQRRAKRKLSQHPKFYFFDAGVFRALRPKGPLDPIEEIEGASIETLVFQEIRAINSYWDFGYDLFYWRTQSKIEVDFILYGEQGLKAIEVKRSSRFKKEDLECLLEFKKDYSEAECYLIYGGKEELEVSKVKIIPIELFLKRLPQVLGGIKVN